MKKKFKNAQTVGKRIQILREKSNLSQKEFARLLKVSPQTVQKWEEDQSRPQPRIARQICRLFNVEYDTLFGNIPAKEKKYEWNMYTSRLLVGSILCMITIFLLFIVDADLSKDTAIVYLVLFLFCALICALTIIKIVRYKKHKQDDKKKSNNVASYKRK